MALSPFAAALHEDRANDRTGRPAGGRVVGCRDHANQYADGASECGDLSNEPRSAISAEQLRHFDEQRTGGYGHRDDEQRAAETRQSRERTRDLTERGAFVALRRTLRDEAEAIAVCAPQAEMEVIGLGRVVIRTAPR